jgi:serine/threonine protein kinase
MREFILDICYGLDYIHSQNVIHRDLKPNSIFLTNDFKLKIAGFGLSCHPSTKTIKSAKSLKYYLNSLDYCAPEIFSSIEYNYTCDLYSLGAIIYFLIFKNPPKEDYEKMLDQNGKEYEEFIFLIKSLMGNPKERISIRDIVDTLEGDLDSLKFDNNTSISFSIKEEKKTVINSSFQNINIEDMLKDQPLKNKPSNEDKIVEKKKLLIVN